MLLPLLQSPLCLGSDRWKHESEGFNFILNGSVLCFIFSSINNNRESCCLHHTPSPQKSMSYKVHPSGLKAWCLVSCWWMRGAWEACASIAVYVVCMVSVLSYFSKRKRGNYKYFRWTIWYFKVMRVCKNVQPFPARVVILAPWLNG